MSTYLKQNPKNRKVQTQTSSVNSIEQLGRSLSDTPLTMPPHHVDEVVCNGNLPLPIHVNRTNFKHSDVLVPWKKKGKYPQNDSRCGQKTFYRYYHVFEADELERLCTEVPQIQVLETKYDQGNWSVLLRKLL